MSRPGSPDGLEQLRADIIRWLDEDIETYGHLYGAAYEGRRGGRHSSSTICRTCGGTGWNGRVRCEQCTPARSDPTGDVVVNMVGVRDQLGEFTVRVGRMWAAAKGNRTVLRRAEDVLDRQADTEIGGAELRRGERRTADEVGLARAARVRRLARGERLPGSLPRAENG